MEDASDITDTLLSGKAVVLNLEGIHVRLHKELLITQLVQLCNEGQSSENNKLHIPCNTS